MKACKGLEGASPLNKGIMTKGIEKSNITRRSTMTGGETYISWSTIFDEENLMEQYVKKQLDRGSTWAPHFPLMSRGREMIKSGEYFHQ